MTEAVSTSTSKSGADFDKLNEVVHATFDARFKEYGPFLFTTAGEKLSSIYRSAFPEEDQQHHNCDCCRWFLKRKGNLVFIKPDGTTISAFWDHSAVPEEYRASVKAVETAVESGRVLKQFFTNLDPVWGVPRTGDWTHFNLNAEQYNFKFAVAESDYFTKEGKAHEDVTLLKKAIDAFPIEVVKTAINLLTAAADGNAEGEFVLPVKYFYEVKKKIEGKGFLEAYNLILLQVAAGNHTWNRISQLVVGELLQSLTAGVPHEAAMKEFKRRTDRTVYQRAVAAPTAGNVNVAAKTFESLGLDESDLGRRIANHSEVRKFWEPKAAVEAEKSTKLFGSVTTKESQTAPKFDEVIAPMVNMNWKKFKETVLPGVLNMQAQLTRMEDIFYVITAAQKPDAGQIYFYDDADERNTFSWYTPDKPQPVSRYNQRYGNWVDVVGAAILPGRWNGHPRADKYNEEVILLAGSKETMRVSSNIFEELLRPELRVAGRTIAQWSKDNYMNLSEESNDAVGLSPNGQYPIKLRVRTEFGSAEYLIDRID